MKTWEYKILNKTLVDYIEGVRNKTKVEDFENDLNLFGQEGWELIVDGGEWVNMTGHFLVFKREKITENVNT